MAFIDSFDTICEKASEAAQLAARKTKKLAEIAKVNVSIYSEEDKIKKAQAELGKLYYRDYASGEEPDQAEYLPWCRKIDECKQTIADLRDYIEEIKAEQVATEAPAAPAAAADVTEDDFADLEEVPAVDEADFVVVDTKEPQAPEAPGAPEAPEVPDDEPQA